MSSLKEWYAPFALLPTGWAADVRLLVDGDGEIVATELLEDGETLPPPSAHLGGPVIPGFPNVHSHAFQRGMAGLAEWRATEADSFWSWRDTMYRFVALLEPDDVLAIAELLYCELLTCGYTSVGEFHYLHRDGEGRAFDDPAQLSHAILQAAENSGIGLTLLPTLYTHGGCGNQPLRSSQQRFRTSGDDILQIYESVRMAMRGSPHHRVGVAAHSLRAVDPDDFRALLEQVNRIDPTSPVHMHIAEQQREVDECLAWSGQRPVAWAAEHLPVNANWCLIHATHMMDAEIEAIVKAGAFVGVCPTTEANLGDGVFPAKRFVSQGGFFGIGSDSHVSVSPWEELRLLEYMQRLAYQQRNVLAYEGQSTGRALAEQAWTAGARACGRPLGRIAPGCRADFLVLNSRHPLLESRTGDTILDSLIFAGDPSMIDAVYVGGVRVVHQGVHPSLENAQGRFRDVTRRLLPRLA